MTSFACGNGKMVCDSGYTVPHGAVQEVMVTGSIPPHCAAVKCLQNHQFDK
jgi:hypothetical protein